MSSCASFIFLFLFSFLTSNIASSQDFFYIFKHCPNTTTYSSNITYFTNLKTLLVSLSSRNASYSTGFQNATARKAPDRVTGLFLCRGDILPEVCRNCVTFTVNQSLTRCPNMSQVDLYYDECILRYSNQDNLSIVMNVPARTLGNDIDIPSDQKVEFRDLVSSTLNEAATEAAASFRKFAVRKVSFTGLRYIYGLVQCTPDLTQQDCSRCLVITITQLPTEKIGGRAHLPSCNSRFELFPFFNESAVRTLLPSPRPPPPPSPLRPGKSRKSVVLLAIVVPIIVVVLLFIAVYCLYTKRAKRSYETTPAFDGYDITTTDSLQLDYRTIQAATNDYSVNNKIGQGGFGEVYKGTFSNGVEVAVKRLSKNSGQGEREFKNEVVVVAKLQHRNLVKLLGYSIRREERVLVYEYVPNKSLDYFLFDPAKKGVLDWARRYNIIGGIARGILYLHQDSRLTIIHRDLKVSNILLDADMNPKIADFGMARIFGIDQTQENTSRIVGTYGYMSPEYAMHGQFSMKSDVYSFGVLVLEIISGRKNSSLNERDNTNNLVTYAWRLWNNGTALDLVDPILVNNYQKNEVVRCIHIGLLCVQEDPVERPTLSTIYAILTSNTVTLPVPQQPGFFVQPRPNNDPLGSNQSTSSKFVSSSSVDDASITDLHPR